MNKIITFTILALFTFGKSKAQDVTFGIKIGANYASVTGDNSSSYDPVTAIIIGAMAEITLTEKFAFQPEVVFSRQGFKSDEFDLKLKYMNLPLIAKYYVTNKLSIEAGPQVGFRLLAIADTPLGEVDVRDNIKKIDLGLSAGLGYKLESGFNFGARYNYSFSNINQYVGEKVSNQNAVIQAYAGFFFL